MKATATGVGVVLPPDDVTAASDTILALGAICRREPDAYGMRMWIGHTARARVVVSHMGASGLSWHVSATRIGPHGSTRTVAEGHGLTFEAAHADARRDAHEMVLALGAVSL